jgi:O-antigen/teichoic acid export membrane protein
MKDQLLQLGGKAITYGIGSVLNRFISFLLLPLFTRYLTPSDYGISSILGWMTFLITPIFSLGMGSAMTPIYFGKNGSFQKEATVWSAFTILLISVSLLVILGVPFAKFWSQFAFQEPDYLYLVTLTVFSTALSILSLPFILHLQFEEKATLFSAFTIINTTVSIGMNILLVVVFHRGVQGVIESNLITQVVNLTLFSIPAISRLRVRINPDIGRELLKLGIPLIPAFAFLFFLQQGNRYILQMYGGLDQVGIYTIGYNFGMVMSVPVDAITTAWVPYFMSFVNRREEAKLLFGRIVTFYVIGIGILSLMFYIFAKPVVMLMTQPAFHGAYQVVGLSATAYFLSGLYSLLLPGMYFAKEVKYQTLIQAGAAILGIGANFLFIPRLNVFGAGLGLMFGYLFMVVLTIIWNMTRKSYYLQVQYESKRLLTWSIFYIVYIAILQWRRDFSLLGESFFSVIALIPLPLIIYALLNSWERSNIKEALKEVLIRRHK